MKHSLYMKTLVIGLVILFIGAGFTSVYGKTKNEQSTVLNLGNSVTFHAGAPDTDGTWTITIKHHGEHNGQHYEGVWTFSILTDYDMTPEKKAERMRKAINDKDCPLTASGTGADVKITADNGEIIGSSSKSDDGQMVHVSGSNNSALSFIGTPSSGSASVDVDGLIASTITNGKTLMMIHSELWNQLDMQGAHVMLDPSGLAIYVSDIVDNAGIESNDEGIIALGAFLNDPTVEPFGVYVGMHENIVGNSGSIVTASFDVGNFRFLPDTYKIVVTDNSGWDIEPNYLEIFLEPGESQLIEFNIHIPSPNVITADNIVNVTATSFASPWMKNSGLCWVYVNYPPETPTIDGQLKGKVGKPYTYTFVSTAPDGDDVYYCINWSDGTPEVCIGPYAAGEEVTATHTWSKKGTYVIKAKAKDFYDAESDWGTLSISMPRLKISNNALLLRILERFPHAFPIMRYLTGL